MIKNRLNNFNDLFVIYAVEKPLGNQISLDLHFKIILQIVNKTSSKQILFKWKIIHFLESLKLKIASEKNTDREFDVIDIIEKVNFNSEFQIGS